MMSQADFIYTNMYAKACSIVGWSGKCVLAVFIVILLGGIYTVRVLVFRLTGGSADSQKFCLVNFNC